jgi:cytochrome c553
MAANRRRAGFWLAIGLAALTGEARAQTQQEKQRSQILDELGLKKKPPAPPVQPPAEPSAGAAPGEGGEKESGAAKQKGAKAATPSGPSFTRAVHPLFLATCKVCHTAGGAAAASHLLLTGDPEADHRALARFADVRSPESSQLLQKASGGVLHGGAAPWPPASGSYERVLAWIRAGARLDRAAHEPEAPPPAAAGTVARPDTDRREARPGREVAPAIPAPAEPSPGAPAVEAVPPAPAPTATGAPTFAATVHPTLMATCAVCHRTGGPGGMTRLLLSGDAAKDEAVVRALVEPQSPEASLLVTKASGQMHAGGAPLPAADPRRAALVAWIAGLAARPVTVAPAAPGAPPATVATPAPMVATPAAPPPSPGQPAGVGLPFGFFLNGRFDLNYERRQFTGNPFSDSSVAALRSYHHFLFLSRDAGDPCGLSVEVLTLLFWEGHCRLPRRLGPVAVTIAGGKIVVPFGADPLFHQSYGGLSGFDQVVLPPVWSIEGVAAHGIYSRGPVAVTDDLYVVRGYALAHADSVINLQSDFSPVDAVKLAIGNRLGLAWMGISAWYSAYFNPLGFGRRLFMQAIDVNIWRQRQIPVLGHFSLGFGLLRADVSGGGPGVGGVGQDYYDFADYLQLRYYPVDWLFLQYRTGLFTFDNRRAMVLDNSRLTSADGSTHNFGIVARTRSLWFGIFYFVNLEKVDEVPNDLFRLNVTYEF